MSNFETVLHRHSGRLTPRQWRLFACACVRRLNEPAQGRNEGILDLAERFADGKATAHELAAARYSGRFQPGNPAWAVCWGPEEDSHRMALRACNWTAGLLIDQKVLPLDQRILPFHRLRDDQIRQFHDIASELTHEPKRIDPLWLAWNDGTIRHLAGAIYDERAWDQMPILGDALEDAGCQDARILDHCRGGGPHTRGCWIVDLFLGMR